MRVLKEIRSLIGSYHVKSGVYHYYRNEFKQAIDFFRKALKDTEKTTQDDSAKARHFLTLALMDLAAKYEEANDLPQAIQQLEQAADVSPKFPDIQFRLGRLHEKCDQSDLATAAYRRAIVGNANFLEAQVALAFCLAESGDASGAAAAFREALEIRKRQLDRPFEEGMRRLEAGRVQAGLEFMHVVFRSAPGLAELFLRKALVHLRGEDYEAALEELDRAIASNPKYPDLHNYKGIALCELGRFDEAVATFRVSAELSPRYLVPRLNLAFTHLRAGQRAQAERELEAILKQAPTDSAALAQLEELRGQREAEERRPVSRGTGR